MRGQKGIGSMFAWGFLKSFFIVVLLFGAGAAGYLSAMKFWKVEEPVPVTIPVTSERLQETAAELEAVPTPITMASIDDVSKNLIFCYDSKSNTISRLVLEVFHCEKKQLTYLTIPMNTRLTMSDQRYRQLTGYQPSIPQSISLSAMTGYLETPVLFDCVVLLVEELLKLPVSCYTVLPEQLYQTAFEEKELQPGTTAGALLAGTEEDLDPSGAEPVKLEVFTRDYLELLGALEGEDKIEAYITEIYEQLSSNISVFEKMNYLESYSKTPLKEVAFTRIPGEEKNGGFYMEKNEAIRQLNDLDAYLRQ
ncbi:hypothetical protein HNQ56_002121 [Anaerotaenia torta]|uniref:hypothetical protein n=1 Tax=Anaerotaenia torta TaxID=433293 RepID=UPI003D2524B3